MKIISKFKDYYDHKVGKYGADPLLVFDRRRQEGAAIQHQLPDVPPEWHSEYGSATATLVTLYIGHWRYYLFHAQGRVYGWEEIERMHQQAYSTKRWWQMAWKVCFQDGRAYWMPQLQGIISTQAADRTASLQPQRVSRDGDRLRPYRQVPLLLVCGDSLGVKYPPVCHANPQLSALGIYLDADRVWQQLTEYLSWLRSEAEIRPPVADRDKIANKGFDVKHSFRPKMKNKS